MIQFNASIACYEHDFLDVYLACLAKIKRPLREVVVVLFFL